MKLFKTITIAFALATMIVAQAPAGTVVATDSGSIGGVQLENLGISGGTATIEILRTPNLFSQVNTVNGASLIVPEPASIQGPITLLVTPTGLGTYSLSLVPSTYVKTVGNVPGAEAQLSFNVSTGVAPVALPNFFNMSGVITSVLENDNPRLDYSLFDQGGSINFTFTGTTFTGGISSFAGLFATVGSTITANGAFSQAAVPEPASLGMLGVGMCGLFAFRRILRKRSR